MGVGGGGAIGPTSIFVCLSILLPTNGLGFYLGKVKKYECSLLSGLWMVGHIIEEKNLNIFYVWCYLGAIMHEKS